MMGTLKEICWSFTIYKKRSFRDASTNEMLIVLSVLKCKETILKKINVSFFVHFCLGKYSFSFNTFWKQLIIWRKLTFHIALILLQGVHMV